MTPPRPSASTRQQSTRPAASQAPRRCHCGRRRRGRARVSAGAAREREACYASVHAPAGRAVVARGAALQELVGLGGRHVRIPDDGLAERQRGSAQHARRDKKQRPPAPPRHGASGHSRARVGRSGGERWSNACADVAKSFTAARVLPRTFARQKRSTMASYHHLFHARLALAGRKLSVASASAAEMPASPALWPASAMTRSCASGHARCRSQAERMGHTTS